MRIWSKVLLAVGVAALLAGPSFGQGPPRRGGNQLSFYLDNKEFQKELKLTDEQVTKAKAAAEDVFKKHADDFKDLDFRSPEGREKMMAINRDITKESFTAMEKDKALDKDQIKRFKQILFQQSARMFGPVVFNDADVQKDLKLTGEQKDKIKTINADLNKDREELFKDAQGDPAKGREAFQKMGGLSKEAMEKATKILTADQKKALDELKGEPFEVPFGPPRQ
jgi:Spy/CpxP family protein refolding chaperone